MDEVPTGPTHLAGQAAAPLMGFEYVKIDWYIDSLPFVNRAIESSLGTAAALLEWSTQVRAIVYQ